MKSCCIVSTTRRMSVCSMRNRWHFVAAARVKRSSGSWSEWVSGRSIQSSSKRGRFALTVNSVSQNTVSTGSISRRSFGIPCPSRIPSSLNLLARPVFFCREKDLHSHNSYDQIVSKSRSGWRFRAANPVSNIKIKSMEISIERQYY